MDDRPAKSSQWKTRKPVWSHVLGHPIVPPRIKVLGSLSECRRGPCKWGEDKCTKRPTETRDGCWLWHMHSFISISIIISLLLTFAPFSTSFLAPYLFQTLSKLAEWCQKEPAAAMRRLLGVYASLKLVNRINGCKVIAIQSFACFHILRIFLTKSFVIICVRLLLHRVPSIRENQGKSGRNLFFWKVRESQGICSIL